jgi:hypothetical protein
VAGRPQRVRRSRRGRARAARRRADLRTNLVRGRGQVWEAPRRLGYLWHLRRDRADATDVEITFLDRGDGTTGVEIEHTGWERLGPEAETWRQRNERGWTSLIPHYKEVAER